MLVFNFFKQNAINIMLSCIDVSTGDSMDWAKSKLNVSLSLTYELRDTGKYGYLM